MWKFHLIIMAHSCWKISFQPVLLDNNLYSFCGGGKLSRLIMIMSFKYQFPLFYFWLNKSCQNIEKENRGYVCGTLKDNWKGQLSTSFIFLQMHFSEIVHLNLTWECGSNKFNDEALRHCDHFLDKICLVGGKRLTQYEKKERKEAAGLYLIALFPLSSMVYKDISRTGEFN